MTRMLMAAAYDGNHCSPRCGCEDHRSRGSQRQRENRSWQQEVPEELRPFPDDGELDTDAGCRHGCNGDCVTSGSERCTIACH